jgi:hypothetical protein
MTRDARDACRRMGRLRAMLAAVASLLLALWLTPGQGAQTLREAAAHAVLPTSGDVAVAAPWNGSAPSPHAAAPDADPPGLDPTAPSAIPAGASPVASPVAGIVRSGVAGADLPPARGPPAALA